MGNRIEPVQDGRELDPHEGREVKEEGTSEVTTGMANDNRVEKETATGVAREQRSEKDTTTGMARRKKEETAT